MIIEGSIDIEHVLSQATIAELISLLAGESTWRTAEIERLGVPNVKVSDGPSGARGEIFGEGVPAAFLPCGVSLGATWDVDLIYELGQLLAEETKSKDASIILAPTMCIHRHPLGGRNFESFSEDPFLTGKLATAHVKGVQSRGVGATPKHFIANDQETDRFHFNANIAPRAMREINLLPFQMVVREADPWCMMTSYNQVNGQHCDSSSVILDEIARGEWGWQGLFMSDWGGTTSCDASLNAGLDLEMPGLPAHRTSEAVLSAITAGRVTVEKLRELARRVLRLVERTGRFNNLGYKPEACLDLPEQRTKLHDAACSGIVLLKNEKQVLPLKDLPIKRVAVIGPNAKKVVAGGGGSSYIKAPYWTSIHDSLQQRLSERSVEVIHSTGAKVNRYLPTASHAVARNPMSGQPGALLEWIASHDLNQAIVATQHIDDLYYISFGDFPGSIDGETGFAFRYRTILTPLTTGRHEISLSSIGPAKLYLNNQLLAEESGDFYERDSLFFTYGSKETTLEIDMTAGEDYHLQIDYLSHDRQLNPAILPEMDPMEDKFQGVRLGYQEHDSSNRPLEAAEIAKTCDAVVLVVGRDKEWETESQDIPMFELPGEQVQLIEEVAAVNHRTIVVVQAGTPVNMEPWIHKVQAVLYCWYQGQELGNSAASVILGDFNPSGRLPITFPKRIEDCPAYSSWPGEAGESYYSEGIFVGYRWWDLHDTSPLFPIGYGLSYSQFEIFDCRLKTLTLSIGQPLEISMLVKNLGGSDIPGRETIIAWFTQTSKRRLQRPKKQICGFAKSAPLRSQEVMEVKIFVDHYALGMWDTKRKSWLVDKDSRFDILLGRNALDTFVVGSVHVPEEIAWVY